MNYQETLFYHDAYYWIWVGYDEAHAYEITCAYHKTDSETFETRVLDAPTGIRYLIYGQRGKSGCSLDQIKEQVLLWGKFSSRPYRVAQPCDGSIDACVFALYVHFCRAVGLFPAALYHDAYPDQAWEDEADVIGFAHWQTVAYPDRWTEEDYKGLLESLSEVNNHSLRTVLEDQVERRGLFANPTKGYSRAA